MAASWTKLGMIAGGGALPLEVAAACAAQGKPIVVAALRGFADPGDFGGGPACAAGIGEVGKVLDLFKAAGCDAVTFAGVVKRPNFADLKVDLRGAALLPKALIAARQGDDALLRLMIGVFEKEGFRVIGAEEAAATLAPAPGPVGRLAAGDDHAADIAKGFEVVRALGRCDVGQGAVVCGGLVLAVEAQEGTDEMLARVAGLPATLRGAPGARRGVLVKAPKPIQERRIDLPTLGVATVEGAAAAGLAGVAVEAGGALIIDRAAVAEAADAAGLFVVAVAPTEES